MVASRWWSTPRKALVVDEWIRREFAVRGLTPPHCTPEALAQALERERQIVITFHPHVSDDPGVYGLLYRQEGSPPTYVIVYRQTPSIALRRLIVFHELAHLLFEHPLSEVAGVGALRGFLVSDADDAVAEAFAMGAMPYSFLDAEAWTAPIDVEDDGSTSVLGQLLKRTQYRL
jgi:hypothetical protein